MSEFSSRAARRVVVTGMGVCSRLGDDLERITRDYLRVGKSKPFAVYPPALEYGTRCQLIGLYEKDDKTLIEELGLPRKLARFMGRASLVALRATRTAMAQAGCTDERDLGVLVGNGSGDVDAHDEVAALVQRTGSARRVSPTLVPRIMSSTVSANLANVLQSTGPSFSITSACAGGVHNISMAAQLIEHGFMDMAVAGASEIVHLHFFLGFDAMRAFNGEDNDHPERASRPYAADRAGFIFAEGAGVLVLETEASARARGAEILAVIGGYGMSSNGTGEMVAPDQVGSTTAMRQALAHAGVAPDAVDYVNTHGTSTPLGDVAEIRAMREIFGDRLVPYSSTKGYTGHSASATGAMEAAFTIEMMRGGWLAPSVNTEPLDPAFADYPPIREVTDTPTRIALDNAFGFGGTNACLVLEAP